jgi:peptidylprolyl isomerase
MRRPLATLTVMVAVLAGTAGCGGSSSGSGSGSDSIQGLSVTGGFGKTPTIKVDKLNVTKTETAVVIKGDGSTLRDNQSALLRLLIANGNTGKTLQSNYNANEPQPVPVGQQTDPLSKAIAGQKIGTRIELAMPARQVFGDQGAPQVGLKADDPLVLVVDLVDAAPGPLSGPKGTTVKPPATAPKVVEKDGKVTGLDFSTAPEQPPTKLEVIPLIKGNGPAVKSGDTVTVNYIGTKWGNGNTPFDNSYQRGQPTQFQLTPGGLINGWITGLDGVKVGSRVMLVVPPKLGYGKAGNPQIDVSGKDTLVFVIDVLGNGG